MQRAWTVLDGADQARLIHAARRYILNSKQYKSCLIGGIIVNVPGNDLQTEQFGGLSDGNFCSLSGLSYNCRRTAIAGLGDRRSYAHSRSVSRATCVSSLSWFLSMCRGRENRPIPGALRRG